MQFVRSQSAVHTEVSKDMTHLIQSSVPLLMAHGTPEAKLAVAWILSNLLKSSEPAPSVKINLIDLTDPSMFTAIDGQMLLEKMAGEEGTEHGNLARGMINTEPIPGPQPHFCLM